MSIRRAASCAQPRQVSSGPRGARTGRGPAVVMADRLLRQVRRRRPDRGRVGAGALDRHDPIRVGAGGRGRMTTPPAQVDRWTVRLVDARPRSRPRSTPPACSQTPASKVSRQVAEPRVVEDAVGRGRTTVDDGVVVVAPIARTDVDRDGQARRCSSSRSVGSRRSRPRSRRRPAARRRRRSPAGRRGASGRRRPAPGRSDGVAADRSAGSDGLTRRLGRRRRGSAVGPAQPPHAPRTTPATRRRRCATRRSGASRELAAHDREALVGGRDREAERRPRTPGVAALVASGRAPTSGYVSTAANPRPARSSQTASTSAPGEALAARLGGRRDAGDDRRQRRVGQRRVEVAGPLRPRVGGQRPELAVGRRRRRRASRTLA